MDLFLQSAQLKSQSAIAITGSKSETNRLLLLQALFPEITLENTSNSDDSEVMINALKSSAEIIDIHHAGTAMRFLTAYFAIQSDRAVTLTGSKRMKERPIKILVDALRQLGADINYLENDGFPPIKINGKRIIKSQVSLKADVSSQYISALLLIAPKLENGLQLTLEGEITSVPYIQMTLALLQEIGVNTTFDRNFITVAPKSNIQNPLVITVESDWSSASYYYSIVALSAVGTQITLSSFKKDSFQGDSALSEIYESFGVETIFNSSEIVIRKIQNPGLQKLDFSLNHTPDIAQTITVTAFGLGIGCHLNGLHTLKIKETDRLQALHNELTKLGASISISEDSLTLQPTFEITPNTAIKTYDDHRMAMAFAPLALKVPIIIETAEVVSKSYPTFWDDLKQIGLAIETL